MTIRRGEIVTVAAPGDFGKPRPAVVIQSDAFPDSHASVIICPMTSTIEGALDFRVTLEPSEANGPRAVSQIMVDKPAVVRRERIGAHIGRLAAAEIRWLNVALAFVTGLAD